MLVTHSNFYLLALKNENMSSFLCERAMCSATGHQSMTVIEFQYICLRKKGEGSTIKDTAVGRKKKKQGHNYLRTRH